MKTTAIIPALNEARTIADVIAGVKEYCHRVIVVDNMSTDDTADVAEQAGATVHRCYVKGTGASTRLGLAYSLNPMPHLRSDIVVTLDGDGQHSPDDIPDFLRCIEDGCDIVIGARPKTRSDMPFLRWLGNQIFDVLCNVGSHYKIPDPECGFRAFTRDVLKIINIETNHFGMCEEVAIKARAKGYKIGIVPIRAVYGVDLHKYSFKAQLKRGLEIPCTIIKWRWLEEWKPVLKRLLHW